MEQQKSNPRELTLENCIKMAFYPKGYRQFMQRVNEDLKLGSVQSSIGSGLASFIDMGKYVLYFGFVGRLSYDIITNYLN